MLINKERTKILKEGYDALERSKFYGGAILPTGTGKSWILINALLALNPKSVLYCCDNQKLRDIDFPNELKKWNGEKFLNVMVRMCYQSAYKLTGQHYDLLLMDEGDYACTPEYIKVLINNTFKHIVFVSATLDDDKRKLIEKFIPIVYERELADLDGKEIINDAEYFLVNYQLNDAENKKYLGYNELFKRHLSGDKPNHFVLDSLKRNRKLFLGSLESSAAVCRTLVKRLYDESESNKILVFCVTAEQADKVCKFSFHTKSKEDFLKDFHEGKIRVLSVIGKIDRGVNINGINNIVFEAPADSKTKFTQKSGRGRRLEVDQILRIFFLVPFYRDRRGVVQPTVVQKWILNSTRDAGIKDMKILKL